MNPVALHIVNGDAFFVGTGVLLVVGGVSGWWRGRWGGVGLRILTVVGVLLVVLSATPLAFWFYGIWGTAVVWLWVESNRGPSAVSRRLILARCAVVVLSVTAAVMEAPFHRLAPVRMDGIRRLVIVGDSITARDGRGTRTWPSTLSERLKVELIDQSQSGNKVADALATARQLKGNDPDMTLTLLEIGGNDLLYDMDVRGFEAQLDELLRLVSQQSRRMVMVELPLPPFYNRFGMAQRRLAKRYGVTLIPKRYFAQVLARPENTFDGLHPTQAGHDRLAETMGRGLGP